MHCQSEKKSESQESQKKGWNGIITSIFSEIFFNIDKNQHDLVSLHKITIMNRVSKLTAILAHRGDTLYWSLQLPILRA